MSFNSIIELNNETVILLRNREFYKAINASSEALTCNRSIQFQNSSCDHDEFTSSYDGCLDQCMLLSQFCETKTGANEGFVYEHGIMLHNAVTANMRTAILIFNTALAHHMFGIQHQQYQSLHKARRLYELAYGACDMDHNTLFQFVVINNIFMIDRKLGNMDMSGVRLEQLLSIFMVLVDRGCDMHLRHIRGFLVNLPSTTDTAVAA